MFLVARDGRLLDIVDIGRWGWASVGKPSVVEVPCARAYVPHAGSDRSANTSASSSARAARSKCLPKASRCLRFATPTGTCSICRRSM